MPNKTTNHNVWRGQPCLNPVVSASVIKPNTCSYLRQNERNREREEMEDRSDQKKSK